jgi:hypothetical protein
VSVPYPPQAPQQRHLDRRLHGHLDRHRRPLPRHHLLLRRLLPEPRRLLVQRHWLAPHLRPFRRRARHGRRHRHLDLQRRDRRQRAPQRVSWSYSMPRPSHRDQHRWTMKAHQIGPNPAPR